MKKCLKRFCMWGGMLCLLVLPSMAAEGKAEVYKHPIYAEGEECCCINEGGVIVPELRYQDVTYIPVRTAGEWMGKRVSWQQDTATVVLEGETERIYHSYTLALEGTPSLKIDSDTVTVLEAPQITLQIDGKVTPICNKNGETVIPIMFQDTVYLPLRNIGEITNMEVTWVRPSDQYGREYIFLRTPISEKDFQQANAYIAQQCDWIKEWKEELSKISQNSGDLTLCIQCIERGEELLGKMMQAERPTAPCTKPTFDLRQKRLGEAMELLQALKSRAQSGTLDEETIKEEVWEISDYQVSIFGLLIEMSKVLEQTGSANIAILQSGY